MPIARITGQGLAAIALHPVEFAHELGALVNGVPQHQAFADEACPKEGD